MKMDVKDLSNGNRQVTLVGRMDVQGTLLIDDAFAALSRDSKNVLVDMSGVGFMASLGIRTLVASAKALSEKNGNLVLFAIPEQVESVLTSTGIDQVIPIKGTAAEALAFIES